MKVYCNGRKALRETLGSGMLSILPRKCDLLKSHRVKVGLVQCKNENFPSQITNDPFSTTERIEQNRAFEIDCSSVVGFRL